VAKNSGFFSGGAARDPRLQQRVGHVPGGVRGRSPPPHPVGRPRQPTSPEIRPMLHLLLFVMCKVVKFLFLHLSDVDIIGIPN